MPLTEGAELKGENGATYLAVSPLGQANVWTAVETTNDENKVVVVKEPDANDAARGFPSFQNEMVMHELLKDSDGIRQQRDRIPSTSPSEPPMLVLEITSTTLWSARAKRPFSLSEIKKIARDALIGLRDVHAQGLVYADLKMQNVMLDGFDANAASSTGQQPDTGQIQDQEQSQRSPLRASLGDLGIVMEPMKGTVQPVSYRAPEVYFKGDISPAADIWGWGLIYCHLLEARQQFDETGLYDSTGGSLKEREKATSEAVANDFGLHSDPSYSGIALPRNDKEKTAGDQWEVLRQRGLEEGEVDFLRWVLRASPTDRPSAAQILLSGWLEKSDDEVAKGFTPPESSTLARDSQPRAQDPPVAEEPRKEAPPAENSSNAERMTVEAITPIEEQPQPAPSLAQQAKSFAGDKISFFTGEPGANFFAGRPSPFASKKDSPT